MPYLGRVAGIAAIALGTTALAGCVAPPPPPLPAAAAVMPGQTLPPAPPPAVGMIAPEQTPAYPLAAYPPTANAGPTPLTPYHSNYASPQYGSSTEPAMAPSSSGTMSASMAPYAPPPPRAETPPPPPSPLAMWQAGHWFWNGSQFIWTQGHYVERRSPTADWLPGSWQQGPRGWTWVAGHWIS
ncbi:MAG: hypothetical protein ACREE9_14500 [Stellaceae bacterium]